MAIQHNVKNRLLTKRERKHIQILYARLKKAYPKKRIDIIAEFDKFGIRCHSPDIRIVWAKDLTLFAIVALSGRPLRLIERTAVELHGERIKIFSNGHDKIA